MANSIAFLNFQKADAQHEPFYYIANWVYFIVAWFYKVVVLGQGGQGAVGSRGTH